MHLNHSTFSPSPSHFVPPGEFNPDLLIFPANRSWKTEHLRNSYPAEDERRHTKEDFSAAKDYLKRLVKDLTLSPLEAAAEYEAAWPTITAEPLRESNRRQGQKAWRAFYGEKEGDTQRMSKLFSCLDRPCRYIVTAKDLNLPQELEISAGFYDKAVNEAWVKAIEKLFNTKNRNNVIWFKLEVGENGKIHAHVFASHDAALLHLPRGTTPQHKVRLIETPEGAVSYLLKPALSDSPEHLAIWIQARRAYPKQLPKVSRFRNLPNSRTWGKA
jgi:hypothetical protein